MGHSDVLTPWWERCYGAASAKDRLDCVIRDAINRGDLPGPRCLANGREMAKRDNELAAGITAYADGMALSILDGEKIVTLFRSTRDERSDQTSRRNWRGSDQTEHVRRGGKL